MEDKENIIVRQADPDDLSAAVETARDHGDKVIRLDTLTWDSGGKHLYETFGFHCAGDVIMDYPTAGPETFRMYEYRL